MGIICFFRDMTPGRKASRSRSSVLKACWKMSGLFVAYAAMFGFDKLKEALGQIGK